MTKIISSTFNLFTFIFLFFFNDDIFTVIVRGKRVCVFEIFLNGKRIIFTVDKTMGKVRNALNRSNIYRVTIFFLFTNTDIYANKKKLLTRFVPAARTSNSHETFFFSYLGRAVNCSCLENLRHERHQLARQEFLGTSVKKARRRIPEALTPPAWLRSEI